ncbi:TPA: hypothetical protein I8376_004255 [Citrobacter freundii]|nr:hypothetical protein [Citrobacter freundii]
MFLVNMTAYLASPEQREMGVIDVDQQVSHALRELLTFNTCPSEDVMTDKAKEFAEIATSLCNKYKVDGVLVYAKTYFMPVLVSALRARGIVSYVTYAPKVTSVDNSGSVSRNYKHVDLVRADIAA